MIRNAWPYRLRLPALVALLCAAVVGMSGCSRGKGDVFGMVTHNGKPVVFGTVAIIGSDGIPRYSNIQPDGYYEVFDVPTGPAKIGVVSPDPEMDYQRLVAAQKTPEAAALIQPANVDRAQWFAISQSYSDPDNSGLVCEVRKGYNEHAIVLDRPADPEPKEKAKAKAKDKARVAKDKPKDGAKIVTEGQIRN